MISVRPLVTFGKITYSCLPEASRGGNFSLGALRGVGKFARGILGITLLSLLRMQINKIILSRSLSLSDFIYYSLANTVTSSLNLLI